MTTIDTSRVDRMDVRKRLAEQDVARRAIEKAREEALAPFHARIKAIQDEARPVVEPFDDKLRAHDAATQDDDDLALGFDEDGNRECCCMSGLVILEGDDFVEDGNGRKALTAVLSWPKDEPKTQEAA